MLVLGIFSLMTAVALPNVNISPLLLTRVASIILLYTAALSYNALDIQAIGSGVSIFSGLFQVTSVSQTIDTFIFILAAIILLPWAPVTWPNVKTEKAYKFSQSSTSNDLNQDLSTVVPTIAEYPLIILFSTCGASFLVSSTDLISIYLSIELQSFAVYILARLYRNSESATSAGLKYFLLGGLSSRLILLGSALIYAYTGLTNLESIFSFLSCVNISADNLNIGLARSTNLASCIGFRILVVGFLFKVAAAPFHNWAPDVYDGVPTIVTTWLTIMPKISIFVLLLELQSGLSFTSGSLSLFSAANAAGRDSLVVSYDVWKNLLLVSSLMSLLIGTIVGLAQYRIKRLLAYSTISHVGFLLLALAVNSEESIESFLFYIVQYSLTNLNAFLVILAFGYTIGANWSNSKAYQSKGNTDIQFISDIAGQFRSNPLLGLALTISLFSIAGVPPLIGFFGKQMVLYSATHSGYYFLSFVAIIVSVISASYYLKIVRVIHFDSKKIEQNQMSNISILGHNLNTPRSDSPGTTLPVVTNLHAFTIATLTIIITLFVFKPSIILNSTSLLALTLYHY